MWSFPSLRLYKSTSEGDSCTLLAWFCVDLVEVVCFSWSVTSWTSSPSSTRDGLLVCLTFRYLGQLEHFSIKVWAARSPVWIQEYWAPIKVPSLKSPCCAWLSSSFGTLQLAGYLTWLLKWHPVQDVILRLFGTPLVVSSATIALSWAS